MLFQLRTDNHIKNRENLADSIRADVEAALTPQFSDRLHRIEVYLQDLNSRKGGVDTRCAIEAHLAGHQPLAVTNEGLNVDDAVSGAVNKLIHALEHVVGRLQDRNGRRSMSGEPG